MGPILCSTLNNTSHYLHFSLFLLGWQDYHSYSWAICPMKDVQIVSSLSVHAQNTFHTQRLALGNQFWFPLASAMIGSGRTQATWSTECGYNHDHHTRKLRPAHHTALSTELWRVVDYQDQLLWLPRDTCVRDLSQMVCLTSSKLDTFGMLVLWRLASDCLSEDSPTSDWLLCWLSSCCSSFSLDDSPTGLLTLGSSKVLWTR